MKKQNIIIVIIVLLFLTMSVGYSVFRISTTVQGKVATAKNLNVEFKNIGKIEEIGSSNAFAKIAEDNKTVIINVPNLMYKGAYAVIPITVKNVGQLPAKLESINEYGTNTNFLEVDYYGIAITDKILQPGEEEIFTVKVLWKNELESNLESEQFYIKFNYIQG